MIYRYSHHNAYKKKKLLLYFLNTGNIPIIKQKCYTEKFVFIIVSNLQPVQFWTIYRNRHRYLGNKVNNPNDQINGIKESKQKLITQYIHIF